MATNPPATEAPTKRDPLRLTTRMLIAAGLAVVLVLSLVFSWTTRGAMGNLAFLHGQGADGEPNIVDVNPWLTAQALAPLAVSTEEIDLAREAERLADHEVDQAFAQALRQAALLAPLRKGQSPELVQKVNRLRQTVKADQTHVDSLTQAQAGKATSAGDDLDVAKAQLGLDSDELGDAQQDLARAGGDESTKIQQELAAHEAKMHKFDAASEDDGQLAVLGASRYGTLLGRLNAWNAERARARLIEQAMHQAQTDAAALLAKHNQIEGKAVVPEVVAPAPAPIAASSNSAAPAGQAVAQPAVPDKEAELARLHLLAAKPELLSILDDRIQTEKQLAATYDRWQSQLALQHRIMLHLLLQSLSLISFILLAVMVCIAGVRQWMRQPALDRRRRQTLQTILELGIGLFGALLVLLAVFGPPSQVPTILGFATAGLTVVFQNFILAFFGWFVLMGRNGIRVGDWVEINGVGGEVIEIGLFRTAMLETGNWTDKGHPTGRRVTFINNFAITGQYFNFSTTGQWMWDEIKVNVPPTEDAYATIEAIHAAVLKETEKDARLAEEEWKRATRQQGVGQFSAEPAVDLRPATSGIDIIVRYVTRAGDRFDMRNRLYQSVLDLMHKSPQAAPAALPAATTDATPVTAAVGDSPGKA